MTNMKYKEWVEKVNRNMQIADDEWTITLNNNYYKINL